MHALHLSTQPFACPSTCPPVHPSIHPRCRRPPTPTSRCARCRRRPLPTGPSRWAACTHHCTHYCTHHCTGHCTGHCMDPRPSRTIGHRLPHHTGRARLRRGPAAQLCLAQGHTDAPPHVGERHRRRQARRSRSGLPVHRTARRAALATRRAALAEQPAGQPASARHASTRQAATSRAMSVCSDGGDDFREDQMRTNAALGRGCGGECGGWWSGGVRARNYVAFLDVY